jgi:D-sedoheptulose 7-phosphate isomerase
LNRSFDAAAHVREVLEEGARIRATMVEALTEPVVAAADTLCRCFSSGGKALLLGNGGSASDAQHIAAEWTGRLLADRPALPALALSANTSDLTAIGNDYGFDRIFARLVEAHGREGDVLIAISTSGNSGNVLAAVTEARRLGLHSIGLTGKSVGKLADHVKIPLCVPSEHTGRIQEAHIALLHAICEIVDYTLFPELRAP